MERRWNDSGRGTQNFSKKQLFLATLFTKNPKQSDVNYNPYHR